MFSAKAQAIFRVCSEDDATGIFVTHNEEPGNPNDGLYTRFEWFIDQEVGQTYYCQQVVNATSATNAADTTKSPLADRSDVYGKGCRGQFPWSMLALVVN
jgi:hypothetical protein